MVPEFVTLGGHGLAFAITPTPDLNGSLPSQYLGLLNSSRVNFSSHFFAVEFDTVKDLEFEDINDNHVGIDINSMESSISTPAGYFLANSTKKELFLDKGRLIQAWVDYDSINKRLDVKISPFSDKPKLSLLTYNVDLSSVLGDEMYVGFSASTGLLASSHYILGWNFNMSGEALSLFLPSLPRVPGPIKKKKFGLVLGVSLSVCLLIIAVLVAATMFGIKKARDEDRFEEWELDFGPHRFSYRDLKKATNGFGDKELLGRGGFGKVYKGKLSDSDELVAVKRICHESSQGVREFMSEVSSIGHLRHRNLVQLLGWCRRREDLLLVYDFMPNGSLDMYLFDENPKVILTWSQRFKIIKGVASGLLYLHEGWEQTVIHRDIKAANVLLDAEMNGRVGDFGLAKLYEHGSNPGTTRVVGTFGYLAPELTKSGKLTTSTDVYAFGAVLLEVACGRRPIETNAVPEELVMVDWVWSRWQSGDIRDVVDRKLNGEFDEEEVVMVIKLGLLCSNNSPEVRPSMRQVVMYLEKQNLAPEVVPAPDFRDANDSMCLDDGSGNNVGEFEDFVDSARVLPTNQTLIFPLTTHQNLHNYSSTTFSQRRLLSSSLKVPFTHDVTLTVSLTAGSPPQTIKMVLDTGSELSWLHCTKTTPLASIFDHAKSSSYTSLPCSSQVCTKQTQDLPVPATCDENTKLCHVAVSYADGSSLEGKLGQDTFRFGSSLTKPATSFGCMDLSSSTTPKEDAKTTGLLGMNRGRLSFINQLGLSKFSYCISGSDSTGVLILGDVALPSLKPVKYTPMVTSMDRFAYTVQLEGIRVGSKLLPIPRSDLVPDHSGAGQTILDSGTQFTFLLAPVYNILKTEFITQTKSVLTVDPKFVFQTAIDLCFRVGTTRFDFTKLPPVTLMFNGAELTVSGQKLLYRVPGSGSESESKYCFTFGNSEIVGAEMFIIGNYHQQNVWMEYDIAQRKIGFGNNFNCNQARELLESSL
ncbi:unnamed protein product [Cochlearia groenlandica]